MNSLLSLIFLTIVVSQLAIVHGKPLQSENHHVSESPKSLSRSRRSLTALLAAEVLFLEGLLRAQQSSRKPRKISSRPQKGNSVDPRQKVRPVQQIPKATAAPVQIFKFGPPSSSLASLPVPSSVSSLDPFTMLKAPDLSSKNNQNVEYEVVYQINQEQPAPFQIQHQQYSSEPGELLVTSESLTHRKPKKRTLHYGAFELYQLWVLKWNSAYWSSIIGDEMWTRWDSRPRSVCVIARVLKVKIS